MTPGRRLAFAKARAPVAIAMRIVAASAAQAAQAAREAGTGSSARRSVFTCRAALRLDVSFALNALAGTKSPRDKDLH